MSMDDCRSSEYYECCDDNDNVVDRSSDYTPKCGSAATMDDAETNITPTMIGREIKIVVGRRGRGITRQAGRVNIKSGMRRNKTIMAFFTSKRSNKSK